MHRCRFRWSCFSTEPLGLLSTFILVVQSDAVCDQRHYFSETGNPGCLRLASALIVPKYKLILHAQKNEAVSKVPRRLFSFFIFIGSVYQGYAYSRFFWLIIGLMQFC